MKNYQELEQKIKEAFELKPWTGDNGGAIDFSGGEITLAYFVTEIISDILTIIYDEIEDANESYSQVSYYSDKLHKTIILDASVSEQYASRQALIDSMIEYQKEADQMEDSITVYKGEPTICDCVDCKGNCEHIEPVLMNAEFTGGVVNWCQKCREDNAEFIDELPSDLAQKTLEHFKDEYGQDFEPLDSDNTEDIAKVFLLELNKLMGNK